MATPAPTTTTMATPAPTTTTMATPAPTTTTMATSAPTTTTMATPASTTTTMTTPASTTTTMATPASTTTTMATPAPTMATSASTITTMATPALTTTTMATPASTTTTIATPAPTTTTMATPASTTTTMGTPAPTTSTMATPAPTTTTMATPASTTTTMTTPALTTTDMTTPALTTTMATPAPTTTTMATPALTTTTMATPAPTTTTMATPASTTTTMATPTSTTTTMAIPALTTTMATPASTTTTMTTPALTTTTMTTPALTTTTMATPTLTTTMATPAPTTTNTMTTPALTTTMTTPALTTTMAIPALTTTMAIPSPTTTTTMTTPALTTTMVTPALTTTTMTTPTLTTTTMATPAPTTTTTITTPALATTMATPASATTTTMTTPAFTTTMATPAPTTTPRATTTIMATRQHAINCGWKVVKSLYICGRQVMYTVFLWGTPTKDLTQDLLSYLTSLPTTSKANYPGAPHNQRKFNKGQLDQIARNPSGSKFDITLLFFCIRLACEGMAKLSDPVWNTAGTLLESRVYLIKKARNEALHEDLEMTEMEFRAKVGMLRQLFIDTLTEAQKKFGQPAVDLTLEVQKVHDELDRIIDEPVGEEDLLVQCGAVLKQDLITEVTNHLKQISQHDTLIDPLSFLSGNRLKLQVQKIFTKIRVIEGKLKGMECDLDYEDLLILAQNGSTPSTSTPGSPACPQVLVVEGLAGSGKTTLVTLLMSEWLDGGHGSVKGLSQYQLLLRVQCRNSHLKSLAELLQELMLPAYLKYRSLLPRLIEMCRLLVIVDGIDEMNDSSQLLVRDILHLFQRASECTILCTTRPEAIQDFLTIIPSRYDVTVVELVGIPEELRPLFAYRYFEEIKKATGSTRSNKELVKKIENEKDKEHYRLPLNLLILTWLFFYQPHIVNKTTTQTELYHHTLELCQEKLDERLANNDLTRNIKKRLRRKKVKAWSLTLYQEELVALSNDQLALVEQVVDRLRSASDKEGLPDDEMLSAFLSMRTTWTFHGVLEQYSAPHKGLQEFYAALHIVMTLKQEQDSQPVLSKAKTSHKRIQKVTIKSVLTKAMPSSPINLNKFQNMLQQVAGLLHMYLSPVPDPRAREVVELLRQSGVNDRQQWLDVLEDTKAAPTVLAAIAQYFSTKTVVKVTDNRVRSYEALLPHLPTCKVDADISDDPTNLLMSLAHHTCKNLKLHHHFCHPLPNPTSDKILRPVLFKSQLSSFRGQVSEGMVEVLWSRCLHLTHLHLAVATHHQLTLVLPLLHKMPKLCELELHVAAEVPPRAATPLPDVTVILILSDVADGDETRVTQVASVLLPPSGYYGIEFPRATLDYAGWVRVVERLQRNILKPQNIGLKIPDTCLTEDQASNFNSLIKLNLGSNSMLSRASEKKIWQR